MALVTCAVGNPVVEQLPPMPPTPVIKPMDWDGESTGSETPSEYCEDGQEGASTLLLIAGNDQEDIAAAETLLLIGIPVRGLDSQDEAYVQLLVAAEGNLAHLYDKRAQILEESETEARYLETRHARAVGVSKEKRLEVLAKQAKKKRLDRDQKSLLFTEKMREALKNKTSDEVWDESTFETVEAAVRTSKSRPRGPRYQNGQDGRPEAREPGLLVFNDKLKPSTPNAQDAFATIAADAVQEAANGETVGVRTRRSSNEKKHEMYDDSDASLSAAPAFLSTPPPPKKRKLAPTGSCSPSKAKAKAKANDTLHFQSTPNGDMLPRRQHKTRGMAKKRLR